MGQVSRFGAPITPTIDALIAKLDAAVLKSEYHKVTHEIAGFLQGHRDYIAELEQPAPSETQAQKPCPRCGYPENSDEDLGPSGLNERMPRMT